MAISSSSKRIQLTLNSDKPQESVVLDYLSQSFNEVQEIKRILFEYIVNQNGVKAVKGTQSKGKTAKDDNLELKLPKVTKSKTKRVKDNQSEEKLLANTKNNSKIIEENNNNSKVITNTESDDFTLDLSNFEDKLVEVKSTNKDSELEQIEQNEMDELSKFM